MIQDISDIYLKPIVLGILDKGGKDGDHISERENYWHRDVHVYYFKHPEET